MSQCKTPFPRKRWKQKKLTGLGNEKSRKNNSRKVPSNPNQSTIHSQKVLPPQSLSYCASCEMMRVRNSCNFILHLFGICTSQPAIALIPLLHSSGQGEHVGLKNLVQVHMEPEERLPVLSLLPLELQLALYLKWAQGKDIAKLILSSANPAEANKS